MEGRKIVRIESLAFGGDGVGRLDGRVCFVAYGCPGDLAAVRVVEERPTYLRAEIEELIETGRERRAARCPQFGRCGGCHWQHVTYPTQLSAKERLLAESVRRIGGIEAEIRPIVASPLEYGYRTRARLRVGPGGLLGYLGRSSNELIAAPQCPILAPALESRLAAAARSAGSARGSTGRRDERPVVELRLTEEGEAAERALDLPPRRPSDRRGGKGRAHSQRRGEELPFHQVNAAVNEELVRAVGEAIRSYAPEGEALWIADLYCGNGNLSLPLAGRAARITGSDLSEESIREASKQARAKGLEGVRYSRRDAHAELEELIRDRRREHGRIFLCLIADPPRSGLRALAQRLPEAAPDLLLYVSCNPPALARDLHLLAAHGLAVEYLQPFDMFPQTFHLESLAVLRPSTR